MTPKGFLFSAVHAGIKKGNFEDIGIIVSNPPALAGAVFTRNRFKAAPLLLSMKNIKSKRHHAIICNSACANAATGRQGMKDAAVTAKHLANHLNCEEKEILINSTGVIGENLPMKKVIRAIPKLAGSLSASPDGFCKAIMTTDTKPKSAYKKISIGNKKVTIWGCAKGSGMIHPNMATMLGFILTDAVISKKLLQSVLKDAVDETFNTITVDGDTSTNDTVILLANGEAKNAPIKKDTSAWRKFGDALEEVCQSLAEQIVMDGEGATRMARITVEKAESKKEAKTVARAVAGSLLVKTALNGGDPNWGRILCAVGYSGVPINTDRVKLYFGKHAAFSKGLPVKNVEKKLATEMKKKSVEIRLSLGRGSAVASYLFCDISSAYVAINAHYRT